MIAAAASAVADAAAVGVAAVVAAVAGAATFAAVASGECVKLTKEQRLTESNNARAIFVRGMLGICWVCWT